MDQKPDQSDPEVIKHRMEETRASLTDKLEKLETQVVGTVQGATAAVTDTVEAVTSSVQETVHAVKSTVTDTVESVKESLDITGYVKEYPWLMFGASVAAGFLGGKVFIGPPPDRRSGYAARHPEDWGAGAARHGGALRAEGLMAAGPADRGDARHAGNGWRGEQAAAPARREGPGMFHTLTQQFEPEIDKLKGVAIGTLFGFAREMLTRSVTPQLAAQLTDVIDGVTRKLGGEPVRGPLVRSERTAAGPVTSPSL
jgi:ElaB/YqjD/DUF883 family membrane-anchored ribosome-binding protein